MARVTDVVRVRVPLSLPTRRSSDLGGVAAPVPTVIVEEAVAGLGLKLAVTPPGNPLTPKFTVAVKPPEGVMLSVYDVPDPCPAHREAGVEDREKSDTGAGFSDRVSDGV